MRNMLRGCKLLHGVNMVQGNKKSCIVKIPPNTCKTAPFGISKAEGALSDRSATSGSGVKECIELQKRLDRLGFQASSFTCASVLRVFTNPKLHIFRLIVETTGDINKCLDSLLVQMCIESKALQQAHKLATRFPDLNLLVWNCLIGSHVQQSLLTEAFQVFALMQTKGVLPDNVTFVNILSACDSPIYFQRGKCLHHVIICMGCEVDVVLGTALLTMYSKCGSHDESTRMFAAMEVRNVVSWAVMIGAYARDQNSAEAFHLHDQMRQEGSSLNRVIFLNLLEACSCQTMLVKGKQLHSCIIVAVDFDMHLATALVHMYGKCSTFEDAQDSFNLMQEHDVVMWNALMVASIRHKRYNETIQMFFSMLNKGVIPSVRTYVTIAPACVHCTCFTGKSMHAYIISNRFQENVVIATALLNMYGKLGSLDTATLLFDNMKEQNIVAWNTMIALHAESGAVEIALHFLDKMQLQGLWANSVTYVSSLEAFVDKEALLAGRRLHCRILESGADTDVAVATALVNMYCRCGTFKEGQKVFDAMPTRNLISWNTMISACRHYGRGMQGFSLFKQMQWEAVHPDQATYINILCICANQLVVLAIGRALHHCVMHSGCEPSAVVATSLLDMYGKCGSLQDAHKVFDKMSKQSVTPWNVMISIYAQHGRIGEAMAMVDIMQQGGVTPNNVTFLSLLGACSHTGMLVEAYHSSLSMNAWGIEAGPEQFRCLVDILGRAGNVKEAEVAIDKMPMDPSAIAWTTLLGSCRHATDIKHAAHIVEHILEYDPGNSAASVLLFANSNG